MQFVTELALSVVPAILAAALAARWAATKFLSERTWERKERAYEEILDALYSMTRYFDVHKSDYGHGTGLSEAAEEALYKAYSNANFALQKATNIGSFYISDDAAEILNDLRKREKLDYRDEPKFEFYEGEYRIHTEALEEILKVAKLDLQLR